MNILRSTGRFGAGTLAIALLLAACSSGGAAPSANPSQPPSDTPVSAPPSTGNGSDPGPVIGAKPVVPKPGQAIGLHPVPAEELRARVDGNKIIVTAIWTTGVEPCTILDSIVVDKGEGTYTITLREGSSPQEIACIALAEQHVTEFEIPDVAAGDWTISDSRRRRATCRRHGQLGDRAATATPRTEPHRTAPDRTRPGRSHDPCATIGP